MQNKTESEKYFLSSFISLLKKKFKERKDPLSLGKEHVERMSLELSFFKKNQQLIFDTVEFLKNKKTGGTLNKPNSFIFYLLGITKKEPDLSKDFDFKFELNKEQSRVSPPDIDIDFDERDPILEYLCDVYGEDHMALIGNNITFKPKAAVQFCAKALDIMKVKDPSDSKFRSENDQEAKRISKTMLNIPTMTLEKWLGEDKKFKPPNRRVKEAMVQLKEEQKKYPEVFEAAKKIEGRLKSYGTHAAGVVISKNPIAKDVGLHFAKVKKELASGFILQEKQSNTWMTTQIDMKDVEDLGLLKFDFLQIDTLRQMTLTENLIKERNNIEHLPFNLDELETDDQKVFKTIDENKLCGLFQVSGDAFRGKDWPITDRKTGKAIIDKKTNKPKVRHRDGVMEVIGCKDFNDIVAANAIARPGPLSGDVHKKYRDGKNGKHIECLHPKLEPILKTTYNLLIYQEQLIQMAQALAGFSFAEADKLRKACGKKDEKLLNEIIAKFKKGCRKNGISENVIEELSKISIDFGSYAFNRIHSTAYGFITYQTAYLKTYYTTEFICAILTSEAQKSDDKLEESINSFNKEYPQLKILSPNINKSKSTYYPSADFEIISPFVSIKGIGTRASEGIISKRPEDGFASVLDFLVLIDKSAVDSKTIDLLLDNNTLEDFGGKNEIRTEIMKYERIKNASTKKGKKSNKNIINLF